MLEEFRDMVTIEGIALSDAVQVITTNVAKILKIWPQKGCIQVGSDADFTIIDDKFVLQHVWAKGQHMVNAGEAIVLGTFEKGE